MSRKINNAWELFGFMTFCYSVTTFDASQIALDLVAHQTDAFYLLH
jgi:hypothetical protein